MNVTSPRIAPLVFAIACALFGLVLFLLSPAAHGAEAARVVAAEASGWGLFSAALATGLSSLGAGFAVARLGTAAVGALAEKP